MQCDMKACCRSVSKLWRSWNGFPLSSASFMSWEGAPECEVEQTTAALSSRERSGDWQSVSDGEIVENRVLRKLLKEFSSSNTVRKVAREHLLTGSAYTKALKSFKGHLLSQNHSGLRRTVSNVLSDEGHIDDLLPHFLEHARRRNPLVGPVLELSLTSNLSQPTNWYPWARGLNRRIYYHSGPTNSGKTHAAMERFKSASSGIYCAPLRMLAHEIYHRCNQEGVPCDLHTGEELQFASQDEECPSPHLACTVEMVRLGKDHVYDVAVIDEIQMIEDLRRGGAWTRALLGVPAREVHVCGHGCAVGLVQRLASHMEEQVEVSRYKRLVPLIVEEKGLAGDFHAVRPGDCVIVFSRKQVFEIRRRIESTTGLKCAVVYGSLPPATRVQQAQLFNDPHSDCNIMVATDAVGMGLNLNIRRIVFHTLEKFDGEEVCTLTSAHAKQIAGRAGRYGLDHSTGLVTTFRNNDITQLNELISAPVERAKQAGLYPSPEQIKVFSSHLPHAKLQDILRMFERMAQVDGNYFLCDMDEQMELASKLSFISMPLMDHFLFTRAPVDVSKGSEVAALKQFAELYASGKPVMYGDLKRLLGLRGQPKRVDSVSQLAKMEEQHDITDIYLWLSMRFPESFIDIERVSELQCALEEAIGDSLISSKLQVSERTKRMLPQSLSELQGLLEHGGLMLTKAQQKRALARVLRETQRKKVHNYFNKKKRNRMF